MTSEFSCNIPILNDPNKKDAVQLEKISQSYDGGKSWIIKDGRFTGRNGQTQGAKCPSQPNLIECPIW